MCHCCTSIISDPDMGRPAAQYHYVPSTKVSRRVISWNASPTISTYRVSHSPSASPHSPCSGIQQAMLPGLPYLPLPVPCLLSSLLPLSPLPSPFSLPLCSPASGLPSAPASGLPCPPPCGCPSLAAPASVPLTHPLLFSRAVTCLPLSAETWEATTTIRAAIHTTAPEGSLQQLPVDVQ
jgi:hypothetical protein